MQEESYKTSKFCVGEKVKSGGAIISRETVGKETVVCVLPKNQIEEQLEELEKIRLG